MPFYRRQLYNKRRRKIYGFSFVTASMELCGATGSTTMPCLVGVRLAVDLVGVRMGSKLVGSKMTTDLVSDVTSGC